MTERRSLVAGNWKLNGNRASVESLARAIRAGAAELEADLLICPTTVHLADVAKVLEGSVVALGAQNCSAESSGAFTGEVAAPMLAEFACQYVLVGHSERRALFHESNADTANKCRAVLDAGLTPVLCVGETLEQREAEQVEAVINEQLDAVTRTLTEGDGGVGDLARLIIAYEPVWAIGTGRTASPAQAQEVHSMIRQRIASVDSAVAEKLLLLYGGSVKPDNAASLFAEADIDGGLIGGASLSADDFLAIARAAS